LCNKKLNDKELDNCKMTSEKSNEENHYKKELNLINSNENVIEVSKKII
jgi:hypothetical protein